MQAGVSGIGAGRRQKALRAARWGVVALSVALAVDAVLVEPDRIEVTHHRVPAAVESPGRVAAITDLHTRGFGRRERRLVELLERERPDLVVLVGDVLADRGALTGTADAAGAATEVLPRLHAPLGVWAVLGNWEHWRHEVDKKALFGAAGVRLLVNRAEPVRPDLWLVGLDDWMSGAPLPEQALSGVPEGVFAIGLLHSPRGFDAVAGRLPLGLAGHTHGGQVRLPFMGPFWLPPGSAGRARGWYEERGSRLYVSRGVGMTILPVRLFCRPELAVFDLVPGGEPRPTWAGSGEDLGGVGVGPGLAGTRHGDRHCPSFGGNPPGRSGLDAASPPGYGWPWQALHGGLAIAPPGVWLRPHAGVFCCWTRSCLTGPSSSSMATTGTTP